MSHLEGLVWKKDQVEIIILSRQAVSVFVNGQTSRTVFQASCRYKL